MGSAAWAGLLLIVAPAHPLSGTTDFDLSNLEGDESECTISQDPRNPDRLFAACNISKRGLFAAYSKNGGVDWTGKTILDQETRKPPLPGELTPACCDPSSTWDSQGHLFLAYISGARDAIVVIMSMDGGATFSPVTRFSGSVDQPTIVAADTTAADAPVAVWLVWNEGGGLDKKKGGGAEMVAAGLKVTAAGIGQFTDRRRIPDTSECSFGDVAIAPDGAVVQVCQRPAGGAGPSTIVVSTNPDPFGSGVFTTVEAAQTNVGGFDFIPAQSLVSVDAEAGLAFDQSGRLYLVYTNAAGLGSDDLNVFVLASNDKGRTWLRPATGPPTPVNDDVSRMSQFLPRIAVDAGSGRIAVCWYDCRKWSAPDPPPPADQVRNRKADLFCATAAAADFPKFSANFQVSDATSISRGSGLEYGDYAGLVYRGGVLRPVWALGTDVSTPPAISSTFDAMTDVVSEAQNPNPTPTPPAIQQGGRKPTRTPRPHGGGGH
jgi:hypothetical protein